MTGLAGRLRYLLVPVALGTSAAVAVTACTSTRHPTVAELRAIPGATTTYPGTVVYRQTAAEGTYGVDSGNPATLTTLGCATQAPTAASVLTWFDQSLKAANWVRRPGSAAPTGDFDTAYTWTRGERTFTLSFASARYARTSASAAGHPEGCRLAYQVVAQ